MCLGIPGKINSIEENVGEVDFSGIRRKVNLDLLPDAKVGDYVIVHAGYAIQKLNEEEAGETLGLLKEIYGADMPEYRHKRE